MEKAFLKTLKEFLRITVFAKPRLKGSLPLEPYLHLPAKLAKVLS